MATLARSRSHSTADIQDRLMPWVLITEIYWMSYKLLERRFYHLGVSASQARVLAVLHFATEPIKPSLVATLLFQETQTITGILPRIETRGWVRRLPDPPHRRSASLDPAGPGGYIATQIAGIGERLGCGLFASVLRTQAAPSAPRV